MRRLNVARRTLLAVPPAVRRARRQEVVGGAGVNLVSWTPVMHQSARSVQEVLVSGVRTAGREFQWVPTGLDGDRSHGAEVIYPSTIAHMAPGNVPVIAAAIPKVLSRNRFVASVCYWETQDVKRVHVSGMPLVDEIWTISSFCAQGFEQITAKPVRVIPYPLPASQGAPGIVRQHLGLSDEYVVGFQFDAMSTLARKNPEAVICAYRAAFPKVRNDTVLVIKTVNLVVEPGARATLETAALGRPDIRIIDEFWPREINDSFSVDIDCYVSLHRAEGLGIGMGAAMAAGTPVIATGYSCHLDFMSDTDAILIPYRLVPVGEHQYYNPKSMWAEPDVDAAADALRLLRDDAELRRNLGERGRVAVGGYTIDALGRWMNLHLPH